MTRYIVSDHDMIRAVLTDERLVVDLAPRYPGDLVTCGPADHRRLRPLLAAELGSIRVRLLRPRIVELVDERLDAMERHGQPVDLQDMYALPVVFGTLAELLGMPTEHRAEFVHVQSLALKQSTPGPQRDVIEQAVGRYLAWLVVRARAAPGQDVIGRLVAEHGVTLADAEIAGMARLLLAGGGPTTARTIGHSTLALLRRPDQLAAVRDLRGHAAAADAAAELIRWAADTCPVPRRATEDIVVADLDVKRGDVVLTMSNPAKAEEREQPDVRRCPVTRDLAFGWGQHFCVGRKIAVEVVAVAVPALLRRFPNLRTVKDVGYQDFIRGAVRLLVNT